MTARSARIATLPRVGRLWTLPWLPAPWKTCRCAWAAGLRPLAHRSPTAPWTPLRAAHSHLENAARFPQPPQPRRRRHAVHYHDHERRHPTTPASAQRGHPINRDLSSELENEFPGWCPFGVYSGVSPTPSVTAGESRAAVESIGAGQAARPWFLLVYGSSGGSLCLSGPPAATLYAGCIAAARRAAARITLWTKAYSSATARTLRRPRTGRSRSPRFQASALTHSAVAARSV